MALWQSVLKCIHFAIVIYMVLSHVAHELNLSRQAMARANAPENFILDFDETITKNNTIDAIFQAVLAIQDAKGKNMSRTWQEIIVSYNRDYSAYLKYYEPREEDRRTAQQEIEFCRSLIAVEQRSFKRISDSGIFSGIDELKWEELGRQAVKSGNVVVRDGFEDFLLYIKKAKSKWSIVSVNFSSAFIRGVLGSSVSNVSVLANQPNKNGVLKGPWGPVMVTSDEKLYAALGLKGLDASRPKGRTVYIGDSGTDIECLLADGIIGLVISHDGKSSILKTMSRIGMKTLHIEEYQEHRARTIYWARDYLEIVQSPLMS